MADAARRRDASSPGGPDCSSGCRESAAAGGDSAVRIDRRGLLAAAALLSAAPLAGCGDTRAGRIAAGVTGSARATTGAGPSATGSATPSGPASPGGALPAEIRNGPRTRPAVALTFHGQGPTALVDTLLGELDNGGAKVTVLAVGSWLQAEPRMAGKILDAGHELGNHTQNHAAIAKMDAVHAYAEINQCAALLKAQTGSIGRWFRPSQTQYSTPTIEAAAARVGYPGCLSYDLDSLDYTDPAPAKVVQTVLDNVQNGSIVSMHFGHQATIRAIGPVLDGLRQRGLRPVTMTELMS